MPLLKKAWAIAWKDLLSEWRSREMLGSVFVFALLLVAIFDIAFDLRVPTVAEVVPGVLWVTFAFAGTLELNHSMAVEAEAGLLDGLLLAPMERGAIYAGKVLGNWLFMSLIEALILPISSALFDLNLLQPPLLLTVCLGTIGFAAVGTLLSAMAANTRAREVLLPVLLFPVILPAVLAAVKLTAGILDGLPWPELLPWLRLLAGFDVIFLTLSYLTFDYVVES